MAGQIVSFLHVFAAVSLPFLVGYNSVAPSGSFQVTEVEPKFEIISHFSPLQGWWTGDQEQKKRVEEHDSWDLL